MSVLISQGSILLPKNIDVVYHINPIKISTLPLGWFLWNSGLKLLWNVVQIWLGVDLIYQKHYSSWLHVARATKQTLRYSWLGCVSPSTVFFRCFLYRWYANAQVWVSSNFFIIVMYHNNKSHKCDPKCNCLWQLLTQKA